MDESHRLEDIAQQTSELSRRSAEILARSRKLRAHSVKLIARLRDTTQALALRGPTRKTPIAAAAEPGTCRASDERHRPSTNRAVSRHRR
jgi:hypothetical protein